jgi:hypothetical protein
MVMDENFHVGILKDIFAEELFFRRRSFKKKRGLEKSRVSSVRQTTFD